MGGWRRCREWMRERKAAMVSNLLVVLCGNRDAQPIQPTVLPDLDAQPAQLLDAVDQPLLDIVFQDHAFSTAIHIKPVANQSLFYIFHFLNHQRCSLAYFC